MILTGSFEKVWIQEISKTVGKRGDPKLVGKPVNLTTQDRRRLTILNELLSDYYGGHTQLA
jgi:hypothetical protein